MCCLQNIALRDYQEIVTTGQTLDKVIPICAGMLRKRHNKIFSDLSSIKFWQGRQESGPFFVLDL